jgi:hypothetical protein
MKKIVFSSMVIFLLSSFSASAALIDGFIQFAGVDWSTDGSTLTINDPMVGVATGDLAGQSVAVINPLTYNAFVPLDPLWTTEDFSFAISSLTIVLNDGVNLTLTGFGTLSSTIAGLDPTNGAWSFSSSSNVLNWSSATSAVPVPAAVWLFGTAMVGFLGLRRKSAGVATA